MSSREQILNKLRSARKPFENAPPRPKHYIPVIPVPDASTDGLIERFVREMDLLKGTALPVQGDHAAIEAILKLLREHQVTHILSWDFAHIPVQGLEQAIRDAGIHITVPALHEDRAPEYMEWLGSAKVGISGADAAIAMTGTLVLSTGEGRGRTPTVLPPIWIAVVTAEQVLPRLEDWLKQERARGMSTVYERANLAFVTGPSRTGDIEMQLVLGVHGPGTEYVIIKR
jgi:L-lactate dehydrogenase complex protein LldG